MSPEEHGERVGGCVLLETLAIGARDEVYLARREATAADLVAVKVFRAEGEPRAAAVDRLLEEAARCRDLDHPNIVRVYEAGVDRGRPYVVMEHVEGVTLRDLQERARHAVRAIPDPAAVHLAVMVGEALEHAHSLAGGDADTPGLVHGGLSPAKVMVSLDGAVKLLGFGTSRAILTGPDATTELLGAEPDYLAPEQCGRGGAVDRRADVYSLGVVLFELLAGQQPFATGDTRRTEERIRRGDRPRLRDLRPDISADLEGIVDRATSLRPEARHGSAGLLVARLRAPLDSLPRPGTSAHLAQIVRELFPDRLSALGRRDGPSGTKTLDTKVPVGATADRGDAADEQAPRPGVDEGSDAAVSEPAVPPAQTAPPVVETTAARADRSRSGIVRTARRVESPPPRRRPVLAAIRVVGVIAATLVALFALSHWALRRDATRRPGATPTSAPDAAAREGPAAAPAEPPPGRLVVRVSSSGAVVTAGTERVEAREGEARLELPAGSTSIRVTAPGHVPETRRVEVPAGGEAAVEVELRQQWGRISVLSKRRATVYVDGEKVGPTPLRRHKVPAGRRRVEVRSPRGKRSREVDVAAGKGRLVRFGL